MPFDRERYKALRAEEDDSYTALLRRVPACGGRCGAMHWSVTDRETALVEIHDETGLVDMVVATLPRW